jgi:hypothetical protein
VVDVVIAPKFRHVGAVAGKEDEWQLCNPAHSVATSFQSSVLPMQPGSHQGGQGRALINPNVIRWLRSPHSAGGQMHGKVRYRACSRHGHECGGAVVTLAQTPILLRGTRSRRTATKRGCAIDQLPPLFGSLTTPLTPESGYRWEVRAQNRFPFIYIDWIVTLAPGNRVQRRSVATGHPSTRLRFANGRSYLRRIFNCTRARGGGSLGLLLRVGIYIRPYSLGRSKIAICLLLVLPQDLRPRCPHEPYTLLPFEEGTPSSLPPAPSFGRSNIRM